MNKRIKDVSGKKFGYLLTLKFIRRIKKSKRRYVYIWKFKCICNKIILRNISDIKRGDTKSCGCMTKKLQREAKYIEDGVAALNSLYASYKRHCAKERKLKFKLTLQEFKTITSQKCYYCNKMPSAIKKSKISFYKYNGIDRVDNSKGYIISNVVPCCKECNIKKRDTTKQIILKAAEFLKNES